MTHKLPPLSALPIEANMISHSIREEGKYPSRVFIAVCEYPECTREFDGKHWKVVKDKRAARYENNCFYQE